MSLGTYLEDADSQTQDPVQKRKSGFGKYVLCRIENVEVIIQRSDSATCLLELMRPIGEQLLSELGETEQVNQVEEALEEACSHLSISTATTSL